MSNDIAETVRKLTQVFKESPIWASVVVLSLFLLSGNVTLNIAWEITGIGEFRFGNRYTVTQEKSFHKDGNSIEFERLGLNELANYQCYLKINNAGEELYMTGRSYNFGKGHILIESTHTNGGNDPEKQSCTFFYSPVPLELENH